MEIRVGLERKEMPFQFQTDWSIEMAQDQRREVHEDAGDGRTKKMKA